MVPRQRKIKSDYNIQYVHEANGRIVYRPYIKKSERHSKIEIDKKGFLKPPIKLGKPGDDPDMIMRAYLAAKKQILCQDMLVKGTLGYIVQEYLNSRHYRKKPASSQKRNRNLMRILEQKIKINNKPAKLSDLNVRDLEKPLMNSIAEKRLAMYKSNGKKGEVQVNREVTFVSASISWAINYIPNLGLHENPLLGIKKIDEPKNERHVTDEEYAIQYQIAGEVAPYLQPVFELTYLMGLRGIETLKLRLSDCTEEGIRTHRKKGSKDNIIKWSTRLKAAYDQAIQLHKNHKILEINPHLIIGDSGGEMPKSTLDDAVQRLKKTMESKGLADVYWSLHKLKSKAQGDAKDKDISGLSEAMKRHYDNKVNTNDPVR